MPGEQFKVMAFYEDFEPQILSFYVSNTPSEVYIIIKKLFKIIYKKFLQRLIVHFKKYEPDQELNIKDLWNKIFLRSKLYLYQYWSNFLVNGLKNHPKGILHVCRTHFIAKTVGTSRVQIWNWKFSIFLEFKKKWEFD